MSSTSFEYKEEYPYYEDTIEHAQYQDTEEQCHSEDTIEQPQYQDTEEQCHFEDTIEHARFEYTEEDPPVWGYKRPAFSFGVDNFQCFTSGTFVCSPQFTVLGCITNPHILFNEHGIFDSSFYIITNVWIVHMFICLDCNKQYPIVVVVNFVCYKKKMLTLK